MARAEFNGRLPSWKFCKRARDGGDAWRIFKGTAERFDTNYTHRRQFCLMRNHGIHSCKFGTEDSWAKYINQLRSPSFFTKVKGLFHH
jgi:hypothetical protein